MSKLDWSKAQKPRETECVNGGDLLPNVPKRRPSKESIRSRTDKAVADFFRRGGRVKRVK